MHHVFDDKTPMLLLELVDNKNRYLNVTTTTTFVAIPRSDISESILHILIDHSTWNQYPISWIIDLNAFCHMLIEHLNGNVFPQNPYRITVGKKDDSYDGYFLRVHYDLGENLRITKELARKHFIHARALTL